ncbi:MAG: ABC transporter substrate-binding protein, partial [Nitrospinota bacterium]
EQPDFHLGPPSFKPVIAGSWDKGTDGLSLTFHLRKRIVWSDGVPLTAEDLRFSWQTAINPDVACHLNGGPTGLPLGQIERLVKESGAALELVQCGNMKRAAEATELFLAEGALGRVIVGNDMPSGTGVIPYGVLRTLSVMAGFTDLSPEAAICTATGNTARVHKMDVGIIAAGRPADLAILDAPWGSTGKDALSALKAGDTPSVACVLIDGALRTAKSRNTPPCTRKVHIEGGHIPAAGGH